MNYYQPTKKTFLDSRFEMWTFHCPLNFMSEIPEMIETVILLCLKAISGKPVPSNDIAAVYLLFNQDMFLIESIDMLRQMMNE